MGANNSGAKVVKTEVKSEIKTESSNEQPVAVDPLAIGNPAASSSNGVIVKKIDPGDYVDEGESDELSSGPDDDDDDSLGMGF